MSYRADRHYICAPNNSPGRRRVATPAGSPPPHRSPSQPARTGQAPRILRRSGAPEPQTPTRPRHGDPFATACRRPAQAAGRPALARRGPPIRQAPPATAFRRPLPRRGRTRPGARSRRIRPQPDGLPRFLPGPGGRETPAAGTVRSARSMVAALMFNKPRRTSSARSRWPCRSMASASVGSNGLRRLPQVRSDASLSTTRASRTASSYSRRPGR